MSPTKQSRPRTVTGPTGEMVAYNVRRFRQRQRLTVAELAGRTDGRFTTLTLGRAENLQRKIDVDDLMALAVALGVTPNALLLPPTRSPNHEVEMTGASTSCWAAWTWANGFVPLSHRSVDRMETRAGEKGLVVDAREFKRVMQEFELAVIPGTSLRDDDVPHVERMRLGVVERLADELVRATGASLEDARKQAAQMMHEVAVKQSEDHLTISPDELGSDH